MLGLDQNIETFPIHLVKLDEQIRLAWVACELNFSPDAPLAESGPELINRSMTSSRGQLRWLAADRLGPTEQRSEEHTSELRSLMLISYAVLCLKQKILPP